jgi:hypothetical protein
MDTQDRVDDIQDPFFFRKSMLASPITSRVVLTAGNSGTEGDGKAVSVDSGWFLAAYKIVPSIYCKPVLRRIQKAIWGLPIESNATGIRSPKVTPTSATSSKRHFHLSN